MCRCSARGRNHCGGSTDWHPDALVDSDLESCTNPVASDSLREGLRGRNHPHTGPPCSRSPINPKTSIASLVGRRAPRWGQSVEAAAAGGGRQDYKLCTCISRKTRRHLTLPLPPQRPHCHLQPNPIQRIAWNPLGTRRGAHRCHSLQLRHFGFGITVRLIFLLLPNQLPAPVIDRDDASLPRRSVWCACVCKGVRRESAQGAHGEH